MVLSGALAMTGFPLTASSSIFTVPEGTPPDDVTVTVRVVNVVVSPVVGQLCVLDCADIAVEVFVGTTARAIGTSASVKPNPAIQ